ncbi:cytoplasmic polyadenylation element-binding protein 2 isoform X3 [Pezoporus wallicus]|uniref:cytoplasmic polyadenylation element-binding protein 2 isoform X3 n=1 Tax=Pezoporus wallicus TaxID=35540 RepID=UPI00254D7868|nr:cytoplasmic polyadenylation element-binding protein 2 isoform X3 [Pezoporus wallicus]
MGDRSPGLSQTATSGPNPPSSVGGAGTAGPFPCQAAVAASCSSSSCPFSPAVTGSSGSGGVSGGSPPPSLLPSAAAAAHHQNMQDELLLGVTQQQPGSERLGSSPASGHPPLGHPSSDFKPSLSPHQDLNKQQPQQQQPPPSQLSQKRKEFKQQPLSSPAQLGSSHPLNNHHPRDYHHHPPQQQQQFSHPTDKYQQQEYRQQQQLQLLSAHPPEPPRTGDFPHHRPLSPAERKGGADRGGSELLAPSCPGGSVSADPNVGVAAASCVNPPPSPPHLQARAKLPPMESPPNSHLLGSPGNLLPGGLGSGFSSLQSPEIPSPHHQSGGGSSSAASPPPPPLPGFGTPWSVQTSSPPPQQTQQPPVSSGGGGQISAMPPPSPESETSFYPGIPSSINPAFFQSFSPVSPHNPCAGPFSSPFSAAAPPPPPPPQMNLPQQQQQQQQQNRRSPVSPQLQHQHQAAAAAAAFLQQRNSYNHHQPLLKQSPWSNQSSGWSTGNISWGGMHGRDHRRTGNMGIPGTMNQISPLKKPFSGNVIAPPKFTRSTPSLTPKSWIEDNVFRTDNNSNTLLPLQDRNRMYDSLNMHSLENSLIDIMRAEHDPLKGRLSYPHPGTDNLLMLNDDGLLDDGHSDQVGVLNSPTCYSAHQNGERIERFSRKVFVGGLPPDIDEDEITASFRRFGPLVVDWPHKAESKSYFPPKGYAFLLFQEESSVQALIDACIEEDGKLYLCVSSPTIKDKPVQIRPWNLSDSDFVMDGSQPLDPRKTIFVGGVPRPLRAVELAMIMDRLYGGVCYAGIDTDPELKYPKGAGRVAFSNQQSYIAAISARFVQLQHGDIDKRVEVKPYVLDDQMCDECQGARCGGKFAPFFCANVTCLQYYCEFCWANIHSRAGREFHKPLVKEGADRPRQIHFRWN